MLRISVAMPLPRSGEKPMSRMTAKATPNMITSTIPRSTNGTPRLVTWAM